jgi:ATP-dependent RNA helicase DeaD
MEKFEKLGLSREIIEVLKELKFEKPTEIQEKAIPLAMAGKDIIGGSVTGSGKTLAFASPIIEKLKPNKSVQALILTPTRELAEQVANSIKNFSKNKKLNVLAVYGGVSINEQIRKIQNTDVIVGTPGRILDHLERHTLNLNNVKFLVLDEVDRIFDMGFYRDVEKIISNCPKNRQTMLFSATISEDIDYLAKKHTRNAIEIAVESYVDPSKLKQIYYDVQNNMKFSLLVYLLNNEKSNLVMVFCNTRRNVDFIATNLKKNKMDAMAIHGGITQNKRSRIMGNFKGGGIHVLICTDVAARGLDIPGVSHIYNYDLPSSSNDYIHRIGRTARAGKEGIAISLLSIRDYGNFDQIKRNDSLKIEPQEVPKIERVEIKTSFDRRNFRNQDRERNGPIGRNQRRSRPRGDNRNRPRRNQSPRRNSNPSSRNSSRGKNYNRPRR